MYKLAIKFLIITLLLTGACLMWSSNGKAMAATTSCPSGDSVPADWGNDSDGEGAGVMSSLVMRARDSSGNPMNPHFTLASQAPGWPDDAQIYHWPIGSGGSVSNTDQWPQHGDFQFGTHLSGDGGINCNGWIALGPGIDGNVGNGWVLNCKNPSGNNNIFQVTHIDNPVGQIGQWEMYDSGNNLIDSNVNSGTSPHIKFPVTNGANMRFTFVWVPAPQPTPTYGTCQRLDVGISGNYDGHNKRAHVVVNQVTNGQVQVNGGAWQGGTGGNIDENIPSALGGTGSYDKVYAYQPQANSITATVTVEYHDSGGWHNVPGPNNPNTIRDTSQPCFTASCSIAYVDGDGPGGIVLAGHTMHVHGTYYDTSPGPDNLPIWNPSLYVGGSQNPANNGVHTLFASPPPAYVGYPYDFDMYLTAPNNVTQDNFSLTPIYFGGAAIGGACSGGIPPGGQPTYQQFSATVAAQSDVSPTIENPTSDNYGATITHAWVNPPAGLPGHAINNPVSTSFYQKKAGGGQATPCSPSSYSSSGPYNVPSPSPPGYDTIWSHNCAIAPGSFAAGDEFCSAVTATYGSGYVGPDNNVIFGGPSTSDIKCPRVVNEPYFKVYHSDISAGGDFDKCTTNGGTLAGYADISDPSGATRGSTTQLSALALLKITGVASAKTAADITGSPTKLTFANTGVQVDSSGNESPTLGGQFGGCRTLTNETAPATAKNIAGNSTGAVPVAGSGAYTHTGNMTISGGTLGANQNVSMFVTGNVYISGNITYGNGWAAGTAPSFVLHATGNIYIAPGVKQLAGVYIAQQKTKSDGTPDTTTGKIYDCADSTGFAPMSATNLYNGCKNQLVVYGSFVADQINLMRSFGSLRDEIPNPGSPGVGGLAGVWSHAGNPAANACSKDKSKNNNCTNSNLNCTQILEPGEPASHTWNDNYLCVPTSSSIQMAWTYFAGNPDSDKKQASDVGQGDASISYLKSHGYPYCTQWDATPGWEDNYLCLNQDIGLTFGTSANPPGKTCLTIDEPADSDGQWATGYFLCTPATNPTLPTAKGPPFTVCSNKGTESDTNSCAGEIFEYSPALYLSNGGGTTQPPGGGSLQLQSITSLPPVL